MFSHFYPRPPRGGRLFCKAVCASRPSISIHALREEGDLHFPPVVFEVVLISIHALREEGDVASSSSTSVSKSFLSTPSARRATGCHDRGQFSLRYFYPRPPRGGRLPPVPDTLVAGQFLSTPSARRATARSALLAHVVRDFYPRPPRGGRLTDTLLTRPPPYFYPRPPRGGRPEHPVAAGVIPCISIHALREEGDLRPMQRFDGWRIFLSTPSARRATDEDVHSQLKLCISIHALREEGDVHTCLLYTSRCV